MRSRYLLALAVAVSLGLGVAALAARPAPRLPHALTPAAPAPPSELQRLQVENDMKQLQLYQAQVQILTAQFEQTKAALQVKLKALERDGYDLDLQTWRYVPKGTTAK